MTGGESGPFADRILVFARAPQPGRTKTRLEPLVGAAGAAAIQESFVRDAIRRVRERPRTDIVLYHDPDDPGPVLASLGVALAPQRGADLGERMRRALEDQAETGAERVVVIGCDSPDFPPGAIDRAFEALARADVVLGPAVDGGYWLLGARGVPGAVLEGIPWGTDEVLSATLRAIRATGTRAASLEAWYDVDRPEDLRFLRTHLALLLETGGEDRCPATRAILETLLPRP